VTGRGKCQDLVDCAAIWPSFQMSNANALSIAQNLAKPYGITVTAKADVGAVIPQLNILHGETVYELIELVCRYRALLAYDLPDGNLILAQVGNVAHSSGVAQGKNVQSARAIYSMDQRYSEYLVYLQSMDMLSDAGAGGNLKAKKTDPGVPRFRRKEIICEAPTGGQDISIKRANWEAARRMGRSMQLNVDVDSWRDSAGVLWTPNQLVPISLPILKTSDKNWIIGEVNFIRGDEGSYASLLLMPPDAFNPEPDLPPQTFLDVPSIAPAAQ
jgi:prophage tail gpP-like protein